MTQIWCSKSGDSKLATPYQDQSGEDLLDALQEIRAGANGRGPRIAIDDPILVIGLDYKIMHMNQAARRIARASRLDADDACLTCHSLTHLDDRPCRNRNHPCPLDAVVRTKQPFRVIHHHLLANGSVRKIEVSMSPLMDETGSIIGVIEINRDVSEHGVLLTELKERERKYAHLAHHDPLTGLPNRVLFADRLSIATLRPTDSGPNSRSSSSISTGSRK